MQKKQIELPQLTAFDSVADQIDALTLPFQKILYKSFSLWLNLLLTLLKTIKNIIFSFYFQIRSKRPSLKLDSPPDEELKEKLLEIFLKITEAEKKHAEK